MSGRYPDHLVRRPVNLHTWRDLTFVHFPYDVAEVRPMVPDELSVQDWDGVTWVGITPFRMANVRPPALPSPPGWGAFPELNVRCYVRDREGRDGIWFLGMVVPRVSFMTALSSIGLPYQLSNCQVQTRDRTWTYRFGTPGGLRRQADDWFTAQVNVGEPLAERDRTPLVESITGRWWAYHRRAGILWLTPVQHEPWPLHHARVTGELTAPLRWVGLPEPSTNPMVQAAPAVHARLGCPRPA